MSDQKKDPQKISQESVKQAFWSMEPDEVFEALASQPSGLEKEEIDKRLKIFGPNIIKERLRLTKLKIILNQIKSPLILVLIAAGLITAFFKEWVDFAVIFAAVFINTALGFWQENKAETAIDFLKTYIRTLARVSRANREHQIDASELVPGDVIKIVQGDRIPADARLFFTNDFEIDESILTGEALPVAKNPNSLPAGTALAERKSMIFSGTLAVQGFANAVVTATGKDTEFGKIAAMVSEAGIEPTPLQKSISGFVTRTGAVLGILVAVLFGLGIYFGREIFEMFLIAVAVAVSAVPEGLPIALTVILAIGVQRLAKRKGIIRKLLAAETLGSASVILTDKTGTLTEAKMKLAALIPFVSGARSVKEDGIRKELVKNLLFEAVINTDVIIENPDDDPDEWQIFGRPLEVAMVQGAADEDVFLPEILGAIQITDRIPFSSEYKFSASIFGSKAGHRLVILGAPEVLLEYSSLSDDERSRISEQINSRALSGERVLGVVSKKVPANERIQRDFHFKNLEFKGLISFHDPMRPEVPDAIQKMKEAGVRTIMVTGDHKGTAEALARNLGLIGDKGAILTGDDLKYLTKEELKSRSDQVNVYARVTPEQKVLITKIYKEKGEIVAVTGDGVNDAPALQTADIGIAVGSGTDVAKSAADLVILDDNFITIVSAIEEGRRILDNIRKVIVYLLSDALDELLLIGGALIAGVALPLTALQILFVNFFSDSFPAIALAFEKGIDGLGSKPRRLGKNLFDREMRFLIVVIGFTTSALLFALYFLLLKAGFRENLVKTFTFASFATYTLFLSFSIRSLGKSIFSYNPFSNLYLVAGAGIGIFLTGIAVYLPFLQRILDTVALPPLWLAGVLGIGFLNIMAVEFGKWIFRRRK